MPHRSSPAAGTAAEKPAAAPAPPDPQADALAALVALTRESGAEDIRLEREHDQSAGRSQHDLDEALDAAEKRRQGALEQVEQQYQELLRKNREQLDADLETLQRSERSARQKSTAERASAERDIQKKHEEAEWMATSLYEAARNHIRDEQRRLRERHGRQGGEIAGLDDEAAGWMRLYGQDWSAYAPAEPSGGGSDEAADTDRAPAIAAAGTFDELIEQARERLAELSSLRLPRLFTGVLPFLFVVLALGAGAGAGQLIWAGLSLHLPAMLTGAAIAVAVLVAIGRVARSAAHDRVERAGWRLRETLDAAEAARTRQHAEALASLEHERAEAEQKRRIELDSSEKHLGPLLARVQENHETTLKAVESEHQRYMEKIAAQKLRGESEATLWRQQQLDEVQRRHEEQLGRANERRQEWLRDDDARYQQRTRELSERWRASLGEHLPALEPPGGTDPYWSSWDDAAWESWKPPKRFPRSVRFGHVEADLAGLVEGTPAHLAIPDVLRVPAVLRFPERGSLLIHADQAGRDQAIRTLQLTMIRLLTCMPAGRVNFTIIDPVGLGQNFAGFMHLADYDEKLVGSRIWTEGEQIDQRLADLTEHMETVIQKYLRNEFETIDAYNTQAGELAEPYRFLTIADFPVNFSDVAIRRLNSIASTGARCGVYILVGRDLRQPLPAGTHIDELEANSVNLECESGRFVRREKVYRPFPLVLDEPPREQQLTSLLHRVGVEAQESKRVEVPFEHIAPSPDRIWTLDCGSELQVPVGRMGATRLQSLRLGRGVAQHVLIAGKTGSGKSTLLHVLITNLSLWYGPDQVEFYLVDFKKGVEFKAYAAHALPHARAVAVESDREFGLSVLQRVDAELSRRGTLFRQLGVQDLPAYRQASGEPMPRTLLIIDEFQEFFSEDDRLSQDATLLLDRLVRQGRAFGIHVLLGSQTIGGTSGLPRSTLGQMAVRVALQTSEADSQMILGDANSAARLLSRPGEAIYNDAGGLVEGNSPFQVAWLADETRDRRLAEVERRAREQGALPAEPAVVFEGNIPADPASNPLLAGLIEQPAWSERVVAPRAWLGEPVAIKPPTDVLFRRQSGANLLIVGQQEESALAMLASAMVSLAAQLAPGKATFHVFDGSPVDSSLAQVFPRIQQVLPHEVKLVAWRDVEAGLNLLAEELQRRREGGDAEASAFIIVYGLQRFRMLRRQEESFSFSADPEDKPPASDRQFAELLREGPPVGLHVLAFADTPATVERTFDRAAMREFDYRVLFQMSASDSSNLIDSPLANKLGMHRALAYSEEQGTVEKFRPYALPGGEWLERVGEKLRGSQR